MTEHTERLKAESEFWDKNISEMLSDGERADLLVEDGKFDDRLKPQLPFYGLDKAVKMCIDILGDLQGKKVLDCGCGNGFMTTVLAKHGAQVTAIDISEKSVELTRNRALVNGVSDNVKTVVMDFEDLEFEDESFDFVVGNFVLHHIEIDKTGPEIKKVLKPGGKAVFIETSAQNKLLMMAREGLTGRYGVPKYGTDDEAPLGLDQTKALDKMFDGKCRLYYPSLVFFRLLSGYISFFKGPTMMRLVYRLDSAAYNMFPGLRRFTYYMIVELEK